MNRHSATILCLAVSALCVLGIVMLGSTSLYVQGGEDYSIVIRQARWLLLGATAAFLLGVVDYQFWARWWLPVLLGACVLLALCYVPGIGVERNGETRWISLPGLGQFQPSEPAKVAIILALAGWFHRYQAEAGRFWRGFVMPCLLLGVPSGAGLL